MAATAVEFYQNTSPDFLLDLSAIGKTSLFDEFSRNNEAPGINFALPTTNDVSINFYEKIKVKTNRKHVCKLEADLDL